jgi:hypothetical protein
LAAAELTNDEWGLEAAEMRAHIALERAHIEAMRFEDVSNLIGQITHSRFRSEPD